MRLEVMARTSLPVDREKRKKEDEGQDASEGRKLGWERRGKGEEDS